MSGTMQDRQQGPIWIVKRLDGDKVKFLRRATEDDVEGQAYRGGFGQTEEGVEGQMPRISFLGETEEDVEGQMPRISFRLGETEEDVEGEMPRIKFLGETEEDVEGKTLILRLNVSQDIDLTDRFAQIQPIASEPDDDDVEGQGGRIP